MDFSAARFRHRRTHTTPGPTITDAPLAFGNLAPQPARAALTFRSRRPTRSCHPTPTLTPASTPSMLLECVGVYPRRSVIAQSHLSHRRARARPWTQRSAHITSRRRRTSTAHVPAPESLQSAWGMARDVLDAVTSSSGALMTTRARTQRLPAGPQPQQRQRLPSTHKRCGRAHTVPSGCAVPHLATLVARARPLVGRRAHIPSRRRCTSTSPVPAPARSQNVRGVHLDVLKPSR